MHMVEHNEIQSQQNPWIINPNWTKISSILRIQHLFFYLWSWIPRLLHHCRCHVNSIPTTSNLKHTPTSHPLCKISITSLFNEILYLKNIPKMPIQKCNLHIWSLASTFISWSKFHALKSYDEVLKHILHQHLFCGIIIKAKQN